MKLKGKNAIITGASQGLGMSIAEEFSREGANILLCARDKERLAATCKKLEMDLKPAGKVLSLPCDVSSEQQVSELFAFAFGELGGLDVLVNNAGVYGPMGPTETVPLDEWRRALDINLLGVLLPCRAAIPHFKSVRRGKIIIVAGGGATSPLPNISAYAASKAAVVRLMETLAEELRSYKVDVNAIAPGALATRMMEQVIEAGPEAVGQAFYEKNLKWKTEGATPTSLGAALSVYLAGDQSNGITGKLISAPWDPWSTLHHHLEDLARSDIYCLRRIVPEDRGKKFGNSNK
jgi:NAD(P)-dependent dehydrogenase (short-subunit alcohol dehydrogenase family)